MGVSLNNLETLASTLLGKGLILVRKFVADIPAM